MYIKIGLILIAFGIIYNLKPDLYRTGIWTKTSITQRLLKPNQYVNYMRILGLIFAVLGVAVCIYGLVKN